MAKLLAPKDIAGQYCETCSVQCRYLGASTDWCRLYKRSAARDGELHAKHDQCADALAELEDR